MLAGRRAAPASAASTTGDDPFEVFNDVPGPRAGGRARAHRPRGPGGVRGRRRRCEDPELLASSSASATCTRCRDRGRPGLVPGARADLAARAKTVTRAVNGLCQGCAPHAGRSSTPSASRTSWSRRPSGTPGGPAQPLEAIGRHGRSAARRAHGPVARAGYGSRSLTSDARRQAADPRRQPDPVRPPERAVRARLQPGHAHRRARRAGRPVRPAGRAARRGRRRRRAQAQPRLQPDPRVRARLARSPRTRRPTTSSRRAGPASRRRSWSPTRSRSARSSPASPAASTPPPTRRSRSTRTCARCCSTSTAPRRCARSGSRRSRGLRPGQLVPRHPAQRRAAHRPVDGRAPGDHRPREWGITREAQDELAAGQPPQPRRRLRPRLLRRPGHARSSA